MNNRLFIVVTLVSNHQFLNLLILNHYLLVVFFFKDPFQLAYINPQLIKPDIIELNLFSFLYVHIAFTIKT